MKTLNKQIGYRWIGIIAGLLFSILTTSAQTVPESYLFAPETSELNFSTDSIDSGAVVYYLYACNITASGQKPKCILLEESVNNLNMELLWILDDEPEEEPLQLEPWMLKPQTWINKKEAVNE